MLETSSSQEVLSNLEFIKIWVCWFSSEEQNKILPKEPSLKIWLRTSFPSRVLWESATSLFLVQLTNSPIENIRMSFILSLLSISISQIAMYANKLIGKTTKNPMNIKWIQWNLSKSWAISPWIISWPHVISINFFISNLLHIFFGCLMNSSITFQVIKATAQRK